MKMVQAVLVSMVLISNINAALANKSEWQVVLPETLAINSQALAALDNALDLPASGNKHSFLIIKNEKIIFESYRRDPMALVGYELYKDINYSQSTPDLLFSSTKSVIATLAGIALEQGLLTSLDDRVIDYYPELKDKIAPNKHAITIRHALDMAIGLDFDEWDPSISRVDSEHIWRRYSVISDQERLAFTFNQAIKSAPGIRFQYSGGAVDMVAKVISRASGLSIEEYAQQALFTPLGIENVSWVQHEGGGTASDWGLTMRPRDFAKIGLLYNNNGLWQGKRLLSQAWIDDCFQSAFENVAYNSGYSNFWYQPTFFQKSDSFWKNVYRNGDRVKVLASWGYGGQHLFMFPDLDLVVVTTAGNWMFSPDFKLQFDVNKELSPFHLIAKYVLPAINGKKAKFKYY